MSVVKKLNDIVEMERKTILDKLNELNLFDDLDFDMSKKIMEMQMPDFSFVEKKGKGNKRKYESSGQPRRTSGYLIFCKDFRESLRDENGKIENPKGVIKLAGEKWSSLTEDEKKVWNDKSKEKFEVLVEKYKETHPDYDPEAKPIKKKNEGSSTREKKPKEKKLSIPRAKSPIQYFVASLSKSYEEKGKALTEIAEEKWASMTEEEKSEFEELGEKSKEKAVQFRTFAAQIKEELLAEGIEDNKKALNEAATKKWYEKEENSSEYSSSDSEWMIIEIKIDKVT